MKKYFIFISFFFIISSCGLIGNEKIMPNENAVLSGPPLSIPPDFDIQDPSNAVGSPGSIEIIDEKNNETYSSIPSLEEENLYSYKDSPETMQTLNSNNIQNFETYDPSADIQTFIPGQGGTNQIVKSPRKQNRTLVPSDIYDVDLSRLNNINKSERKSYFGSDNNIFATSRNSKQNQNLSKEEESLLEEIILEFEATGDSN